MSPHAESRLPAWPLAVAIGLLFVTQVYAFHWGVITPDTVFQWKQATSARYDDWHPPATTWLWRQLMPLGPGTAPVLLFDSLLYWAGIATIAETLRRNGRGWAAGATVLVAALPIPFGQMGAILKDPLLAGCCLGASALSLAFGERRPRSAALLAAALLVFASATRFNAVLATAPLLAAWLPDRWLRSVPRALATLAGCGLLLVAGGWAIDEVALRPTHSRPIFSLVSFDLAGIVAQGGANGYPDLDDAAATAATARCYDPSQYNPTYDDDFCDAIEAGVVRHAIAHGLTAPHIFIRAVAASPLAYVRHRLAHLNRNWRFLVGRVPDDAVYVMTTDNDFGLQFTENGATRQVARAARWMAISPLGRPATWIAVAIGLLLVASRLRSRRFVVAVALSTILYACGYAAVSVAADLRYNLWTMLGAMLALVVAGAEWRMLDRRRLALAAAPCAVVVGAELITLFVG